MTNREYEILRSIQNNRTMSWGDLLNAFDPQSQIIETDALLKKLLFSDLIEKTWASDYPPRCRVRLTGKGRVILLEEISVREKNIHCKNPQEQKRLKKIVSHKLKNKSNRDTAQRFQAQLTYTNTLLSTVLAGIIPLILPKMDAFFTAFWDTLAGIILKFFH